MLGKCSYQLIHKHALTLSTRVSDMQSKQSKRTGRGRNIGEITELNLSTLPIRKLSFFMLELFLLNHVNIFNIKLCPMRPSARWCPSNFQIIKINTGKKTFQNIIKAHVCMPEYHVGVAQRKQLSYKLDISRSYQMGPAGTKKLY